MLKDWDRESQKTAVSPYFSPPPYCFPNANDQGQTTSVQSMPYITVPVASFKKIYCQMIPNI